MTEAKEGAHVDLHHCEHDCDCFWCRVSRSEPFEVIEEHLDITTPPFGGPSDG